MGESTAVCLPRYGLAVFAESLEPRLGVERPSSTGDNRNTRTVIHIPRRPITGGPYQRTAPGLRQDARRGIRANQKETP